MLSCLSSHFFMPPLVDVNLRDCLVWASVQHIRDIIGYARCARRRNLWSLTELCHLRKRYDGYVLCDQYLPNEPNKRIYEPDFARLAGIGA